MVILQSIQQFESLRDDWNALADGHGHALLRHDWFASAVRTLHKDDELAIVIEREDDRRLVAAAPLVYRGSGRSRRLELIGAGTLYEPSGFVYRDIAAATRLRDAVFSMRVPVLLQSVIGDAIAGQSAGRETRRTGLVVSRQNAACLGVELTTNDYVGRPSSRLRSDIRRAHTRACELGQVRAEILSPGPDDMERPFADFVAVESAGWKGRRGSALATNPRVRAFFQEYCRRQAAAGTLRVSFLRIDGEAVAGQIATEQYGRLWILKIGYDERAARCSPGFLLNAEVIGYARARGLKSYEFLGASEEWERRWRPVDRPTCLVAFYPWSVRGCLNASVDIAGKVWRRLSRASARIGMDHSGGTRHGAPGLS